ncbi:MFS transporter [Microbacterium algeriense]|uniref:MFS transporter n=1 Tax=Microbacterium algeriense TaxID=2615184 RepID=UPI0029B3E7BA|nr:MFS transporter [Microbacterium algeriense]MDX2400253.1 MFS transporter [Microbacterium algeriense]
MTETSGVDVGGTRRAVSAYAASATLVRSADAGAIVGFVLLASSSPSGASAAGILAAALTAPHLAGPLVAPILDRSTRPRTVLATAFVLYALTVGVAAVSFTHGWLALSVAALVIAGSCGSLLTGGLSSRLGVMVSDEQSRQRRAQGLDALTYGVAAALGPVLVTLVAASASPVIGVLAIGGMALVAAITLAALPPVRSPVAADEDAEAPPPVWQSISTLLANGPLRRVTLCTSMTAVAVGAVPILAVASSTVHGFGGPEAAAVLATAFGAGTLAGSICVIVRPLRGSPESTVTRAAIGVCIGLILCALAPMLALAALAYATTGAIGAIQFAASLAARVEYSPPESRAQVFMTMAGLKVACSSAGVALAGLFVTSTPLLVLVGAALMVAGAAIIAALDRFPARASA